MRNNRKIIIGVTTLAIIVVGITFFTNIGTSPEGYVNLIKAPKDMKLTVDGKEVTPNDNGILELSPGTHKISGTRTDFEERQISVHVKQGDTVDANLFLDPLNAVGRQYYDEHPEEVLLFNTKSSQAYDDSARAMLESSPIIQSLPMIDPNWRIDYGESVSFADKDGAIAIFVYAATPEARQNALGWIRLQGYDPSDMEIIFETP